MAGLGEFIQRRREELSWSQGQLADRVGMKRAHLSQIESGKISLPNADVRRRLARALRVSSIDLLIAAGELAPDEVPGTEMRELSPPYDAEDDRAILIAKINDLSDEAIDALMVNAIWWEGRIKSRIVGQEPEAATAGLGLGFYAEHPSRPGQW